jgi:hypothetical protein
MTRLHTNAAFTDVRKRTNVERDADYRVWLAMRRRDSRVETCIWAVALVCVCAILALTGCATATHNDAGGYVEACEDLPGMLGDDC